MLCAHDHYQAGTGKDFPKTNATSLQLSKMSFYSIALELSRPLLLLHQTHVFHQMVNNDSSLQRRLAPESSGSVLYTTLVDAWHYIY